MLPPWAAPSVFSFFRDNMGLFRNFGFGTTTFKETRFCTAKRLMNRKIAFLNGGSYEGHSL
jgi:hypothetical protein